jgi:hypothetical protein
MSHTTSHVYRGFSIRFDELEPQNSITMSKATWTALEQLETGKEEIAAKRYQVKSKPKFADGPHELESHYASKHEAESRARSLKDAGYSTEIVEPTVPEGAPADLGTEPAPPVAHVPAQEWDSWTPEAKDAFLKEHPGAIVDEPITNTDGTPVNPPIENQPPAA